MAEIRVEEKPRGGMRWLWILLALLLLAALAWYFLRDRGTVVDTFPDSTAVSDTAATIPDTTGALPDTARAP